MSEIEQLARDLQYAWTGNSANGCAVCQAASYLLIKQDERIKEMCGDLSELNKRNHELLSEILKLESNLSEQMVAYAKCASKRDALVDEIARFKPVLNWFNEQVWFSSNRITELESEIEALKIDNASLTKSLSKESSARCDLEDQVKYWGEKAWDLMMKRNGATSFSEKISCEGGCGGDRDKQ